MHCRRRSAVSGMYDTVRVHVEPNATAHRAPFGQAAFDHLLPRSYAHRRLHEKIVQLLRIDLPGRDVKRLLDRALERTRGSRFPAPC